MSHDLIVFFHVEGKLAGGNQVIAICVNNPLCNNNLAGLCNRNFIPSCIEGQVTIRHAALGELYVIRSIPSSKGVALFAHIRGIGSSNFCTCSISTGLRVFGVLSHLAAIQLIGQSMCNYNLLIFSEFPSTGQGNILCGHRELAIFDCYIRSFPFDKVPSTVFAVLGTADRNQRASYGHF